MLRTMMMIGAMSLSASAMAQHYGPQDEGRRFNDGSKVQCRNVEVQRNSKDPTALPALQRAQ